MPNLIDRWLLSKRETWAQTIEKPSSRLFARLDMLFIDHGIVRKIYSNRACLDPNYERMGHPTPSQVKAAAERGIKSIVNLRGDHPLSSTTLSYHATQKIGLKHHYLKLRSRGMPTKESLRETADLLGKLQYPILVHCKSGADRAGLMSSLYLLIVKEVAPEVALKQLSLRYGHIRQAKTGMLDFFVETYRDFNAKNPIGFMDWVENHYDEDGVLAQYYQQKEGSGWANFLVDRLLRRE